MSTFRSALLRWIGLVGPETGGMEALFAAPSPDEVARRRRELTVVYWWLREALPDVWYFAPHLEVLDMAEALVTLRRGVEAGRWEVETVV